MSGLREHYRRLYREHGDSPHSLQMTDRRSQRRRFEILSQVSSPLRSVVDVGCGLGHFCEFLRSRGFGGSYLGLDFVPEFITAGKAKHAGDPRARFALHDIAAAPLPGGRDWYFLSGVFNNERPGNERFMLSTIEKMFRAARRGVAFNAMSTYVDYRDKGLYYSDPLKVFDFCKRRLTRRVTLRHDYLVKKDSIPFEYAVFLYK